MLTLHPGIFRKGIPFCSLMDILLQTSPEDQLQIELQAMVKGVKILALLGRKKANVEGDHLHPCEALQH